MTGVVVLTVAVALSAGVAALVLAFARPRLADLRVRRPVDVHRVLWFLPAQLLYEPREEAQVRRIVDATVARLLGQQP